MRKPALIIAALCVAAVFFGWKVREAWLAPTPAVGAPASSADGIGGASESAPPPQQDFAGAVAAVAARPLFRPDRVAFGDGAGPGRDGGADLSRLSLIGVMAFGQGLKGVVLSKDGSGHGRWELKAGDSFLGYKVADVRLDGVVLAAEGRKFLLPLYAGAPAAEASVRTDAARNAPPKAPATGAKPSMAVVQPPRDAAKAAGTRPAAQLPPTPPPPPNAIGKGAWTPTRTIHEGYDDGENQ